MDDKIPATEILKRSWSEGIWNFLFHDSELQQGKKAVLVVLASDRNIPEFAAMYKEFKAVEKELDEIHDIKVFFEDHPGGLLHEKFAIDAQEFHWFLIDIHGNELAESKQAIRLSEVMLHIDRGFQGDDIRPAQLS